jgi:hypothetical protein
VKAFLAILRSFLNPKCDLCGKRIGSTKDCHECDELNADMQSYRF